MPLQRLKRKAQNIAVHPKTKETLMSLKPNKMVWGFLGIILFFILPEIVAFIWGDEITSFARTHLNANDLSPFQSQSLQLLVMLFEDGGSWLNLAIGIALLVWLFF